MYIAACLLCKGPPPFATLVVWQQVRLTAADVFEARQLAQKLGELHSHLGATVDGVGFSLQGAFRMAGAQIRL